MLRSLVMPTSGRCSLAWLSADPYIPVARDDCDGTGQTSGRVQESSASRRTIREGALTITARTSTRGAFAWVVIPAVAVLMLVAVIPESGVTLRVQVVSHRLTQRSVLAWV